MMTSKQRKRKIDNLEESTGAAVSSKYFKTNTNVSKIQLKKNIKGKSSGKKTLPEDRKDGEIESKTANIINSASGTEEDIKAATEMSTSKVKPGEKFDFKFYDLPCEDLAKELLGQILVMKYEGKRLAGKIVETEAYLGPIDKGAHSSKGKTERNAAMFMKPGTAYVYNIYGMYCCMNISARGDGAAVLLRALQPVENLEIMDKLRTKGKKGGSFLKKEGVGLCNGPSKLCQALGIKKDAVNKVDLCVSDDIWVEKGEVVDDSKIVKCKRINIDYAQEWKDKPLRFYILGNAFNSVKDKLAEKAMNE